MEAAQMSFRRNFYSKDIEPHIDVKAPGIYEWRIEGVGIYIGKALQLNSRIRAYPNNVRRMICGLSWHGNPEKEFRKIHKALREAHDKGLFVTVTVLENCSKEHRGARELYWIAKRREEAAAGGPNLLNAD